MLYNTLYNKIPNFKKITSLQNIESGSCYIFGDGKSLKYYNLSNFSNFPSISLGYLSLHNCSKLLNLKYSLQCDSFSFFPGKHIYDYYQRVKSFMISKEYSRALNHLSVQKLFNLFFTSHLKLLFDDNDTLINSNFISHFTNYNLTKFHKNSFYFDYFLKLNKKIDENSNQNYHKIYKGSLFFSIYFAIFLGFNKIYLVGCDYNDIEPTCEHWWEKGKPVPMSVNKSSIDYLNYMRKFIEIKIITLNKSYGENYISYKDFSGEKLQFKENIEIIKSEKKHLLHKLGLYNI